jgi:predicted ATPase/DNA-binding SARP family transcriptional activator
MALQTNTREASPAASAGPALSIRLLGGWDFRVGGEPLPGLRSRSEQWLLALLALRHDRETDRQWLAEALWPESEPTRGLFYLRRGLTDLRRALAAESGRLLSPSPRTIRLDLSGARCDVACFDAAIARADPASLEEAVSLYGGPLLEGCPHDWALQAREARQQAYLNALERLAVRAASAGDPRAASGYLRQALAVEPLRESLHARLMEALAAAGDDAAVLQVYRDLRILLHREINSAPGPETTALFERLRGQARPSLPFLRSSTRRPARLPQPLNRLIGREEHLAEVRRLLATAGSDLASSRVGDRTTNPPHPTARVPDRTRWRGYPTARLLTLTGPGGVGKTRLAVQVAGELPELFSGGICFVELAPLSDPTFIPQAIAGALGVREEPGRPLIETLADYLSPRSLLLVLDNCEHLLADARPAAGCSRIAERLLGSCPGLRILATSREALRLAGEVVWPVPPLSLPPPPSSRPFTVPPVAELLGYGAVQLFVERAAQIRPDFRWTTGSARLAAEICRRLDGIPLAIELAAARVTALSLEQIADRLARAPQTRFQLLRGGTRTALPRHQTLWALIDWSYDLLSEEERTLLRRLSVFAGSWTLEAAEAVCGEGEVASRQSGALRAIDHRESGLPTWDLRLATDGVLDLLAALVEKSLVIHEQPGEGGGRYRLLETIRQYAAERLVEQGETDAARDRHSRFFVRLAEAGAAGRLESRQSRWLDRLEAEHENLRAAAEWASERGQEEIQLRMVVALWGFWMNRGYLREGRQRIAAALASGSGPTLLRARALQGAWSLAYLEGDYAAADTHIDQSLTLAREAGDPAVTAVSLAFLGAQAVGEAALDKATACLMESLALARQVADSRLAAIPLFALGLVARARGDFEHSLTCFGRSLAIHRETGDTWWTAQSLLNVAVGLQLLGRYEEATGFYREGLPLCLELGDECGTAWYLESLAGLAAAEGRYERAATLMGASDRLLAAVGSSLVPELKAGQERTAALVRGALSGEAFAGAWEQGRAMTLEQAVAHALEPNAWHGGQVTELLRPRDASSP